MAVAPRLVDGVGRLPTTSPEGLVELFPDLWFRAHLQVARKRAALLDGAVRRGDNRAIRSDGCQFVEVGPVDVLPPVAGNHGFLLSLQVARKP